MGRKSSGKKHRGAVPPDPQKLFQNAVSDYQAGRYRKAQRSLAPLLELPDDHGFVTLLAGLVHVALGDWEQGRSRLTRAVRMLPDRLEGWMGLGNAQRMQGDAEAAVESFRRALQLQPRNADILNNLAIAYADMRRDHDAIAAFEQSLQMNPHLTGAARGRAEALVRVGRFDEASAAYRELLERTPDDAGIALDYAGVLEKANRTDEAAAQLPDGDALDSATRIATRDVLQARLMEREGRLTEAIELLADTRSRTGQDWVGYTEGRLRDREGDFARAMECFRLANEARGRQWMFRRLRDQEVLPYLDHKIGAGIAAGRSGESDREDGGRVPVFIVGLPRSGTTLLDRMLDAHPRVQVLEEPESLRIAESVIAAGGNVDEARRRYWAYLEQSIGLDPDALIVDKNPLHSMHLDQVPALFPTARVIYSLRHPHDAALSCYMQDFAPNPASVSFLDLASTASLCRRLLDMMEMFERTRPGQVRRVCYEDLVSGDLREQIEPVLGWLGLEWHDDIERFTERAGRSGLIRSASYAQVTRGVYSSAVERWRNYAQWLQPVMDELRPRLEYWGYEE